jgi:hypothetical protein
MRMSCETSPLVGVANGSRGFLPSPRHRTNRSISPVKSGGQARLSKSTGEGPCLRAGRLRALWQRSYGLFARVKATDRSTRRAARRAGIPAPPDWVIITRIPVPPIVKSDPSAWLRGLRIDKAIVHMKLALHKTEPYFPGAMLFKYVRGQKRRARG